MIQFSDRNPDGLGVRCSSNLQQELSMGHLSVICATSETASGLVVRWLRLVQRAEGV
jgi:hypothetical protein